MGSKLRAVSSVELCEDGVVISVFDKAVSINDYKKMHFSKIARTKQNYRSVLDTVLVGMLFDKGMYEMSEDGVFLKVPLFKRCSVTWGIGFALDRDRDLANYTQKILQDAMVGAGFFEDDNYKIIHEDSVIFLGEKDNVIMIFVSGTMDDVYAVYFKDKGAKVSEMIDRHKSELKLITQEDDGEY